MIAIIPNTLTGHVGAALSALIIAASCIGLTLCREVYENAPRKGFFCYFTNLSNLLVLLYFALIAPRLYARAALRRWIPMAEFSVVMCIMLTHIVFHFLILPKVRRYTQQAQSYKELRMMAVNTLFVHYIVPWLTFIYWLICSPKKHTLPLYAALLWTLIPIGYACMIFLRAAKFGNIPGLNTPYPYPFLDLSIYSAPRVVMHCAGIFAGCVMISGMLLLLTRFSLSR